MSTLNFNTITGKRTKPNFSTHSVGQRNLWLENGFATHYPDQNRADPSLNIIIGFFKDSLQTFDLRKLYNLRQLLLKRTKDSYGLVDVNAEVMALVKRLIGNQTAYELIMNYIQNESRIQLDKLDTLIFRFEETRDDKPYY